MLIHHCLQYRPTAEYDMKCIYSEPAFLLWIACIFKFRVYNTTNFPLGYIQWILQMFFHVKLEFRTVEYYTQLRYYWQYCILSLFIQTEKSYAIGMSNVSNMVTLPIISLMINAILHIEQCSVEFTFYVNNWIAEFHIIL